QNKLGHSMRAYTYTTIDDPSGPFGTVAQDINDAGQIVGWGRSLGTDVYHGFLYSGGSYTILNDPLSGNETFAQGINDAGQIVGYYVGVGGTYSGVHGFLYSGGSYTIIDDPLGVKNAAMAINAKGQILGDYNDSSGGLHGFLYDGGSYITLD